MLEGETTRTVFVTDRFRLEVTFEETDKDGKTVYRTVSYDKLRLVPGKFIAAICILLTALTVELSTVLFICLYFEDLCSSKTYI